MHWVTSLGVALGIAGGGYWKRSLNGSGAVGAVFVGWVSMFASPRTGMALIAFFVSSSLVTRVGGERKKQVEDDYKHGGQRSLSQVLANAAVGVVICLALLALGLGDEGAIASSSSLPRCVLLVAFLAQMSCVQGDTWSSELGVLGGKRDPYLITSFRRVPPGTNGGVSLLGTLASVVGGSVIGLTYFLVGLLGFQVSQPSLIFWGAMFGFVGSTVDSIMGATLQISVWDEKKKCVVESQIEGGKHIAGRDILDNHQVNFLSSLVTAVVGAIVGMYFF